MFAYVLYMCRDESVVYLIWNNHARQENGNMRTD